jgi:hypothetical protein
LAGDDPFTARGWWNQTEVLAMIADAHPEISPQNPRPTRENDEWLWECATEFCAAMDRYTWRAMGGLRVV